MEISVSKECIAHAKDKMQKAILHLEDELKNFRAGKANPGIFQNVLVDYYGTPTPVPQVASVTTPDAKTILIQPWEKKLIPAIEKAILDSNIGYTPANNGEQIRINVPALTEERRKELVKQAKTEGENAKVSIRNARREVVDAHKKYQKDGLPEDVCKDAEATIQKETDAFNKKVDEIIAAKEKEIMTV
ncbi:MAG: ribosome recycling factor [Bacteroidales bacterium]|jgi:ribosome recycling factor|nr:ribosome recycling factor [Bacteroidales bacterium]MBO7306000.1 ribosome recycling factor [Bacteroidales bacterium]MBQ1219751.1 ribosome recycling factor [Bacteroidales bacterium]MBQ1929682.1 ribosome recycling factor [Bacteroidales bacterium]MBQ5783472.1 ribosome recycling factor [Bacteroidales bacterium]